MNEIKFEINNYEERRSFIAILVENGYKVRLEKRKRTSYGEDYFVVVELKNDE